MTQISKINGIPVVNTSVSAFTYDGTNQFTIGSTDGVNFNASIDVLSATTFSGVTYYGDGSNLTGIVGGSDTYTTGLTFTNNTLEATNSTGGTYSTVIETFTGLTVNGDLTVTGDSLFNTKVAIGTSAMLNPLNNNGNLYVEQELDANISGGIIDGNELSTLIRLPSDSNGSNLGIGFASSTAEDAVGGAITFERTDSQSKGQLHFATKTGTTSGGNVQIHMSITDTGDVNVINALSATTFYGDGSNLTGTGEVNTASNLTATGFFGQKNGVDLEFKGLTSTGATVTITTDGTTVNVENAAGGGESNTASNVGGANNVFYQKSGVDLQFRTLSAGTNVTITSGTTALTINATGGGGSSRVTGSTQTTNATPTEVDKINTLTDNTTNIVEVYIKAYETAAAEYGVWKRTLTVTSVGGTVVIREENADVDKTSAGLNANSLTFTVNGSDIDIDVTGIAATTIDWESAYEIIL